MAGRVGWTTCAAIGSMSARSPNRRVCIFDRLMALGILWTLGVIVLILTGVSSLQAQSQPAWKFPPTRDIIVTPDNFRRVETDLIFGDLIKRIGLGRFMHAREFPAIDSPTVFANRDTLLSMAVFDLDA